MNSLDWTTGLDYWTGLLDSLTLSACTRVTVVICLSVCVSLSTLEASLYNRKENSLWHHLAIVDFIFNASSKS